MADYRASTPATQVIRLPEIIKCEGCNGQALVPDDFGSTGMTPPRWLSIYKMPNAAPGILSAGGERHIFCTESCLAEWLAGRLSA